MGGIAELPSRKLITFKSGPAAETVGMGKDSLVALGRQAVYSSDLGDSDVHATANTTDEAY